MKLQPIHTEKDYEKAVARIDEIFDAKPGTSEGDELEILGMMVDQYEENHFPISKPTPIEAIKFRMEQLGLEQKDLANMIGSKSRASEILSGTRTLSLRQIKILHHRLNIPAEVLIGDLEPSR